MNRDEWFAFIESEPLTDNQRRAIMRSFERLRFHPRYDRTQRLEVCARLLGLAELDSVKSLSMADAGRLVFALRGVRDRGELLEVTAHGAELEVQADEACPASAVSRTWPEVLSPVACALLALVKRPAGSDPR